MIENVFRNGRDFINPKRHLTPLILMENDSNPFAEDGVEIWIKALYQLSPNGKAILVFHALERMEALGMLDGKHTLVESSSGSTVVCAGLFAQYFGIKRVVAIVPADMAPTKFEQLRLAGVQTISVPKGKNGIVMAKEMAKQPGWVALNQYETPFNLEGHEQVTAEQVWRQTNGEITIFCTALGTSGTAGGAFDFFLKKNASVAVVGVGVIPTEAVPGMRTKLRLGEIGYDYMKKLHEYVEVGAREAFRCSLFRLYQRGIMAGPSCGAAVVGAEKLLAEHKRGGTLGQFRNKHGKIVVVVPALDTPTLYHDKYSLYLDGEELAPPAPIEE